jgi:predicted Ser/Thr protein kinase
VTTPPLSPEFLALQRAVAGRYSLVRELGHGGMGIVYLARDVALDRLVAIKLLPPAFAERGDFRERFLREARLAASLTHPNVVPIHLVETSGELVYFVMAFVDGESLGERIRRAGPMPPAEVMRIVQDVAWALAHAHARGVVHRDVKPDNILIERETGRALVTDFGIARAASSGTPAAGAMAGTPRYLSPEVARGEAGDGRADLYALGVTAWYALTGRHPIDAPNVAALLVRQASESPPSLASTAPEVPGRFARAIDRCLAILPDDRWPGADALATEIDAARARVRALPAPVRAFVAEAFPAGDQVALGLSGAATSVAVLAIGAAQWAAGTPGIGAAFNNLFLTATLVPLATVFLGLALLKIGSVGIAARDLVESGYGFEAAREGLLRAEADQRAEADEQRKPTDRQRAVVYGLTGLVKEAVAIAMAMSSQEWLYLPGIVLAVLIPPFTARTLWRMLRRGPSPWSRVLRGWFGRFLFRGAKWLTRGRALPAADASPTIIALGGEAEATFQRLPAGLQDDLRAVPRLLHALTREGERLRAQPDDPLAAERLATVAAAMEAIRLDLLSIEAGLVSVPDVTRHLEDAERLAQRIDDALSAPPYAGAERLTDTPTPA